MNSKGLILVVDDDPDIVATSRIILEGNGYEVHTASNGKEALALQALTPEFGKDACKS
jgi:CheY-like chemotaxis protein